MPARGSSSARLVRAAASPSLAHLALLAADGSLVLTGTDCPVPLEAALQGVAAAFGARSSINDSRHAAGSSHMSTSHAAGAGSLRLPPAAAAAGGGAAGRSTASSSFAFATPRAGAAAPDALPSFAEPSSAGGGGGGGAAWAGAVHMHVQARVQEVARLHSARVTATLWLSPQRLVTAGDDGNLRVYR